MFISEREKLWFITPGVDCANGNTPANVRLIQNKNDIGLNRFFQNRNGFAPFVDDTGFIQNGNDFAFIII